MFPDIINGSGETEVYRTNIEQYLQVAWNMLSNSLFESLVESILRTIEACISAKG
jgi:hypothetical protein